MKVVIETFKETGEIHSLFTMEEAEELLSPQTIKSYIRHQTKSSPYPLKIVELNITKAHLMAYKLLTIL
jgi:hypothetical protein